MRAVSPVRAVRSCRRAVCCVSEQSRSISRTELCDMNDCYSRLKALVPSIPRNKSVSQVEILQHVIDYICDLQIALEAEDALRTLQASDLKRNFSTEEKHFCH
ncbi:hypothetical protein WMY93_016715 [Mugilogobius chulae]|uniref:BHLH domain-containing protein n=1 Tax=Mugilogobius chulae TaxID=88201 RepID=A0AAW0NMA9_9GOBI